MIEAPEPEDDALDGELVPFEDVGEVTPVRRWVPSGQAAAALAGKLERYDPQGLLSAEAEAMFELGEAQSTIDAMRFQWLRFGLWCHERSEGATRSVDVFEPLPANVRTLREWIAANYSMRYPDGTLRGRRGQPYAPATVRLSLAAIARAHRRWYARHPEELARFLQEHPGELEAGAMRQGRNRGALPTPTAHPDVVKQMRGYSRQWKKSGYTEDVVDSITVEEMYALVRSCELDTVPGLRDAFLMRLAADTGRRNSELMSLNWKHLAFRGDLLVVTVPFSKVNQEGKAGDRAYVEADHELEPSLCTLVLGRRYRQLCQVRGFGRPGDPVFHKTRGTGQERKDGTLRGVILPERMTRKNFQDVVYQAAEVSGVRYDSDGEIRKITPHAFRVYLARRHLAAGGTIGALCDQGGWSRTSPVVLRYDREAAAEREENTSGALIRRAELERRERERARKAQGAGR